MNIEYQTVSVAPDRLAAVAREVEETGYDSLWASEIAHDPFVGLTATARHTTRISLHTGVAVAFARNPMSTAMAANDLQLASGGRFVLGLGSQIKAHVTRRYGMPWSHPAARMREYVQAVRAIWDCFATGERLRFRGEFYRHTLMAPFFNPGPNPYGTPPILLGGVGELMTEVAGEVADGFIVHSMSSRRFLEEVTLPALRKGRAAAGRTMDGFRLHVAPIVATGPDEAALRASMDQAREQIAFYVSTPTYAALLDLHGLGGLREELHRLLAQGRTADMARAIDDDVLATFAAVGEPEQVAAQIYERFGDLTPNVSFYAGNQTDPAYWRPLYEALRRLDTGP